jgi:hypothetical protein
MSKFAPAQYPVQLSGETPGQQLSEQDLEMLQEIHELINLMMREIPVLAQITARSYVTPMIPAVPYTYSFYQYPWGIIPYLQSQGL